MKEKTLSKNKVGGVSAKILAIPVLFIVSVLLVCIVFHIIDVNRSNNNLFNLMQQSGDYQIDATSMMASNTVMSETCNTYLQKPLDEHSESNFGSLMTYVQELTADRRAAKVAERFRGYDVSVDVLLCVERAAEFSEQMNNIQMHAVAVVASVYPLPDIPALEVFSNIELTQEELALNSDERVEYARNMIVESNYVQLRVNVNDNITNCNNMLSQNFAYETEMTKVHINTLRNFLWGEIIAVVVILAYAFVMLYLFIFRPLRLYSKNISENKNIEKNGSIYEMNQLVHAFNGLWEYRNKLESILRKEAENDALTGLPNRYSLERDLMNNSDTNKSVAVIMFDVNFLKKTNDTKGHLAGDRLIRTAASCVKECFGVDGKNNCYRVGGDEFIALMFGFEKDEIKTRMDRFKLALVREDISVSVGFAFSGKQSGVFDFKKLMEEADKKMYEQKKQIHNLED